jgi:HipA-like protein
MGKSTDQLWKRMVQFWSGKKTRVHADSIASEPIRFSLLYDRTTIGELTYDGREWTFVYTDAFRESRLRPITEFPDETKVYKSAELWPFFLMRIPSLRRAYIKDIVSREHIDEADEALLLKRFGRRTVANPFELIVADEPLSDAGSVMQH